MGIVQARKAIRPRVQGKGVVRVSAIRTLILECIDQRGASHIRELHIEILRCKSGTPEHTIRARLSEAVTDGLLSRLGEGFYDVYAEDEGMTSVVSYPKRCSLWGNSRFQGQLRWPAVQESGPEIWSQTRGRSDALDQGRARTTSSQD